jgi:outer membrane protein TolC
MHLEIDSSTGVSKTARKRVVCSASVRYAVKLALIVAVAFLPGLAGGQAQSTALTVDQCIALAKSAPSAVKRASQQLAAARQGVLAAKANFLPQLSISNTFTYNSPLLYDRGQFSFIALNSVREYSTLGTTALEVDSAGRLRALLDRARADEKIAAADVTLSDRDLARTVAAAYYRLLLARRLAASAHENLDAARDFEQKVKNLVAGEEASQADENKASLEVAVLENIAQASDLEAEMANHDLASFWTTDVVQHLTLADDLDREPASYEISAPAAAYLTRPEFRLFDAQEAAYTADSRQARARMLPQLNLVFQYGLDSAQWTSRNRGYAGFVHLEIPVSDWFGARKEQKQFQFQAQEIATDRAIATRVFSKEYQDALASVNVTYDQTRTTEREVGFAKENLRLSQLRFQNGEGTALDAVTSQNALVQAEIDFYSSRANYLNAQSALKVASGQ